MTNRITKVYKNWTEYEIYASGWASGAGDVSWPASSTDGNIALFNWTTGKIIKDSWKKLSDYQTALSTQTAYSAKWTTTKVPQITTNTLGQVTTITEKSIAFPVSSVWWSTWAVELRTINNNAITWSWNISVWTLTAETVASGDSGTTYTIKVANSDPSSWTPATTITFVTA